MFADPNYFLFAGLANCNSPCAVENPAFAWNHGDVQSDISTTWLGMVGPGVEHNRVDKRTWSDHTDIRPTMMLLLGLPDDYSHDGRALIEDLRESALPAALASRCWRRNISRSRRPWASLDWPVSPFPTPLLRETTRLTTTWKTG
jgi:hypothetical protein